MSTYGYYTQSVAMTALAAGILLGTGCSTPIQDRTVETSGFLGDYSQLKPGEKGEAQLIYIDDQANFAQYTKIVFEPITIRVGKDSKLEKISAEERQELVNYLDAAIREQLKGSYTFVGQAGADTMHLRVAITDGSQAKVVLNTMSTVVPIGLAVDLVKYAATGTHMSVGEASIEMELTDSVSNKRLAAAVDARSGRKSLASGNFTRWGDVQDAYNHWASQLNTRLTTLRNK